MGQNYALWDKGSIWDSLGNTKIQRKNGVEGYKEIFIFLTEDALLQFPIPCTTLLHIF